MKTNRMLFLFRDLNAGERSGKPIMKHLTWMLFSYLDRYMPAREEGQALSEYSITLALLVVVTIVAITALGLSVFDLLQNSADAMSEV